ncbi:hypothetical protein [Halopseudomonas aestusnigri]|uniref:hypothetical protein n=1 Tax=Halopseudomonas aestusnigri TaxID=857252 RepID=UPI003002A886
MLLITSAAYIDQEFVSELGVLPPSFLPLGNKRLFEYQIDLARKFNQQVFISVPDTFELSFADWEILNSKGVEVIKVPSELSLGGSIRYCIDKMLINDSEDGAISILHGDTLFECLSQEVDVVSVSTNRGYYSRAVYIGDSARVFETRQACGGDKVASGYFSFSSKKLLAELLIKAKGSFVDAINAYSNELPLSLVELERWYDFGHINAYFLSRAAFTTQRSFNDIEFTSGTVTKTSFQHLKMKGEVNWFRELPPPLKIYTPRLLDYHISNDVSEAPSGYTLEYVYNLPLSDLFVFGRLDKDTWRTIFMSCKSFMDGCKLQPVDGSDRQKIKSVSSRLYYEKTMVRLKAFSESTGFDLWHQQILNGINYPSLAVIAEKTSLLIGEADVNHLGLIHGDFCFSNILYDFRTRRIKVIDPRGVDVHGDVTNYGDRRYDLAKLHHSVIGLYDVIIAGRLSAKHVDGGWMLSDDEDCYHKEVADIYKEVFYSNMPELEKTVHAISIQLFLSMLPLHSDRPDRQASMIANAIRLYANMDAHA